MQAYMYVRPFRFQRRSWDTTTCKVQSPYSEGLSSLLTMIPHTHGRRRAPLLQVLLVGILGEDRVTCGVNDTHEDDPGKQVCAMICFALAIVLLIMLCVTLLTNDAARNMAAWTFEGDFTVGAVVGLVLCVSFPVLLGLWLFYRCRADGRLVAECPLVAESDLHSSS